MKENILNISADPRNSVTSNEGFKASVTSKLLRAIMNKVASAFGILVVVISVLFIFSEKASAQTFVCTDIVFNDDYKTTHSYSAQRVMKALGAIANLEEYDNNIRLRLSEPDRDQEQAIIMERQPNGTYHYVKSERNGDKAILSIDKVLGYYKGLKLEFWEDNKLSYTFIFKRK